MASLACLIAGPAPAQVTNVYNLTTQTVTNNVGVTPYTVPVTTTFINGQTVTGSWLNGTPGAGYSGDVFVRRGAGGSGSGTYRRLFDFGENNSPSTNLTVMQNGYNRPKVFDTGNLGGFDEVVVGSQMTNYLDTTGQYFVMALDINETGGGSEISLDDFRIYTSTNQNPTVPTTPAGLTNLGTLRYQMNGSITQNFVLAQGVGSGAGDLFLFVEKSLLVGAGASDYVFFYVSVGQYDIIFNARDDRFGWNNGFEEFALLSGSQEQIPEPPVLALGALGLMGCLIYRARRRR